MTARVTQLFPIIYVGIDVGCDMHSIAIANDSGELLKEFEIKHNYQGFKKLLDMLQEYKSSECLIAMEGYNGWARPLDEILLKKGYKLYNVNNLKLNRFKEIFPASAKTDKIDARKIIELFILKKHLTIAKDVLQEIRVSNNTHQKLKKLTRRRKQLIKERASITNRLGGELQAQVPELKAIAPRVDTNWFLTLLTLKEDIRDLKHLKAKTFKKIKYIKDEYIEQILKWQKESIFSEEIEYISEIIYEDAIRVLELNSKIKKLDKQISMTLEDSKMAKRIITIPGFGNTTAAELSGEIGDIDRFKSEKSLALYLGVTNLDKSSGKQKGSKTNKASNRHAKIAILTATRLHAMRVKESKDYLDKKIKEGKKYQQAIRSLARHLVRVIWKMIVEDRDYEIK